MKPRITQRIDLWRAALILLFAAPLAEADADELNLEDIRPAWSVGQKWIVETHHSILQRAAALDDHATSKTSLRTKWEFLVEDVEVLDAVECFRVHIRPLTPSQGPETTLWVARSSMTIKQVRRRLFARTGASEVEQNFGSSNAQPFPVAAGSTMPPIDLPLLIDGAKGNLTFTYASQNSKPGAKNVGNVRFQRAIRQRVQAASSDLEAVPVPPELIKSGKQHELTLVELTTTAGQVRQWWRKGAPWPVWSTSAGVTARLVEPTP